MTKREREQLINLIAELDAEFQSAQAYKEMYEKEVCDEKDAQYWDGVQGGLATAELKLREILG